METIWASVNRCFFHIDCLKLALSSLIPTCPNISEGYTSIKKDIAALAGELLQHPQMGTPLGHDCYKIRMAISAKG